MLIRMTLLGTHITAVLAAGAVATGGVFGAEALANGPLFGGGGDDSPGGTGGERAARTALVIDASLARDGRDLVDPRLEYVDAAVRLPRSADEARTNVRYFDELDYRVYVAGAQSTAAAERTGVNATTVDGLDGALAAAR
jgi:hypothetical protein